MKIFSFSSLVDKQGITYLEHHYSNESIRSERYHNLCAVSFCVANVDMQSHFNFGRTVYFRSVPENLAFLELTARASEDNQNFTRERERQGQRQR